jgi:TPR repeat protein
MAADQGASVAQVQFGKFLEFGLGVAPNPVLALNSMNVPFLSVTLMD